MSITEDEIASQPQIWTGAMPDCAALGDLLCAPGERVLIAGCGTSAFVAASLASLREAAGLGETDWAFASEAPLHRRYDRLVVLTRSGTTTEVLECLAAARATRRCLVTAVADSPAAQAADRHLVLPAADEQSVVQTRFPTTVLLLARAAFGQDVDPVIAQGQRAVDLPLPVDVAAVDHLVYLGTGWTIGLAHEAALKVREAAQAWSESYPAMDYRHGPVAVAGPRSLVWVFGPPPPGLVEDVQATGALVLHPGTLPEVADPLAQLVLAQRLAVALAQHRGLDPDHPRHLSRSVILDQVQ